MEPGEGSAAPKATVALPGTDVKLAGRAPARLAVHCSLATGGPGAATRHAPFGRPRRPLGTFPRGESTSSARRRAKPPTRNKLLAEGRKRAYLSFSVSQRISPQRRRPGGFPIAPWTPSGPIPVCVGETCHKKPLPCGRHEKGLPFPLPPFGASFPKPNTGGGTAPMGAFHRLSSFIPLWSVPIPPLLQDAS